MAKRNITKKMLMAVAIAESEAAIGCYLAQIEYLNECIALEDRFVEGANARLEALTEELKEAEEDLAAERADLKKMRRK